MKVEEQVKNLERRLGRHEEEINQEWQRRKAREGVHARAGATNGPMHHSMSTSDFIKKVPKFGGSDKREDDKLGRCDFRTWRDRPASGGTIVGFPCHNEAACCLRDLRDKQLNSCSTSTVWSNCTAAMVASS